MPAIFYREMSAYYLNPLGYIFTGVFLLLSGCFFSVINIIGGYPGISPVFDNMIIALLFLIPLLTMRLLAEERHAKTDQMLITAPITITAIVIGKFLAAVTVFLITLMFTGLYILVIDIYTALPYPEILCSYFGIFLLGVSFISLGLFVSSLTENQLYAAAITFGILLLMYLTELVLSVISSPLFAGFAECFALIKRYRTFSVGMLDMSAVTYFLSIIFIFVFLTVRVLEKRRWG